MENQKPTNLVTFGQEFFEPVARTRSNTWPLPRPEGPIGPNSSIEIGSTNINRDLPKSSLLAEHKDTFTEVCVSKKNQPSRNAHGNSSYAELITQAISGAKNQRLTLAEIYKWMIEHVPSIKVKEGSTGWKNSVRHNLSLHSCFIRVTNENAGQSSWWMINPNEHSKKSYRKRSATVEAKKFERIRGRAIKKAQFVKREVCEIKVPTNHNMLHQTIHPDYGNNDESLIACVNGSHQSQLTHNKCIVPYAYSGKLDSITAAPDEVGQVSEYHHSSESVLNTLDNVTEQSKTHIGISQCLISENAPDKCHHEYTNGHLLTRFNSFLDDINEIISKEMIDCQLKMK